MSMSVELRNLDPNSTLNPTLSTPTEKHAAMQMLNTQAKITNVYETTVKYNADGSINFDNVEAKYVPSRNVKITDLLEENGLEEANAVSQFGNSVTFVKKGRFFGKKELTVDVGAAQPGQTTKKVEAYILYGGLKGLKKTYSAALHYVSKSEYAKNPRKYQNCQQVARVLKT